MGIWPCGVQETAADARALPVACDPALHRLCVDDVKILMGFPVEWELCGCRSARLGQLGNAVPPPLGQLVAEAVRDAIEGR